MSKSKFGFTNTEAATTHVVPTQINVVDNYACTEDEANIARFSNVTCPLDQPEILSYTCQDIPTVNSSIKNQYPPSVKDGVSYGAKLEELLSVTSDDGSVRTDYPIVVQLTVRHSKNGYINADTVEGVIERLLGSLRDSEGNSRLTALMRQSLKPTVN